ncbi:hypothetical protein GCM10023187_51340 [Nibrella viscosa]|uniref:Uncharacterized protein n=1 Tax=Nibrella viscosa TaxID=1084524 RepID=A0ABP8KWL6_9BACT
MATIVLTTIVWAGLGLLNQIAYLSSLGSAFDNESETPKNKSSEQTYEKEATLLTKERIYALVPVPSMWKGVAVGNINGAAFRLPIKISIQRSLVDENNPFNVAVSVGNQADIGSALISSALSTRTPYSGRQLTLQYFTIYTGQDGFQAVLSNTHVREGAVGNFFTSPNISSQTAPDIMKEIYKSLGPESFYFLEQTKLVCQTGSDRIRGTLQGNGHSVTGIFATGTVRYSLEFTVVRQ